MPEWGNSQSNIQQNLPATPEPIPASHLEVQQVSRPYFNLLATRAPALDFTSIAQRTDEVNTIQRILFSRSTSVLTLTGESGAGKTVLAALFYRRVQSAKTLRPHQIWLTIGTYTTIPDIITAILLAFDIHDDALTLFPQEHQLNLILQLLRRPQQGTLLVLDQIDRLFDPETYRPLPGRGATNLFLEMLQQDLGESRCLMTCYSSPYAIQEDQSDQIRSYLVTRITIPEGIALLQQRELQGNPAELSLVWQRCAGHAFSLILFSILARITNFSLSYLLTAPEFQALWSGEITPNLIQAIFHYLNPVQRAIMRVLCLFKNPVTLEGLVQTLMGDNHISNQQAYEHEIASLVNFSLVQVANTPSNDLEPATYYLHDLLRTFVFEHYLDEDNQGKREGEIDVPTFTSTHPPQTEQLLAALVAGHRQIARYYLQRAEDHFPARGQRRGIQDVGPLINAFDHLCLAQNWQEACERLFAEGLNEDMLQWGAWQTLARLYTAMLPPQGVLNRRDQGLVSANLALLYNRLGDQQQSQHYYEQTLTLQQNSDNIYSKAITLVNQGELFRSRGEWQRARANFEQARQLNNQVRNAQIEAASLHNLGLIHQNSREYEAAMKAYLGSLHIAQQQQQELVGQILTSIGMLFYDRGSIVEALAILLHAYHLRQTLQDPTLNSLQLLLRTLERQMGSENFRQCCQQAQSKQAQILSRLLTPDVRQ
ncbi:MAG TPA: tetratricopeptide repeat protein [Ktedonobacteraceae bacterium]|nr:tetratricopeptide repeat protein [Ktedonobacteraceae bacterium]